MPDDFIPTPQEDRLIACAERGDWWEPEGDTPDRDPTKAAGWDESRTIRAEVIRRLAIGAPITGDARKVSGKGIMMIGARITGALDLEGETLGCSLWLHTCAFDSNLNLQDAVCRNVSLGGSHLPDGLNATRVRIAGSLYLRGGFTAQGEVSLRQANITGQLSCVGGHFENYNGAALNADSIVVGADALLSDGFTAKSEIRLPGAHITGQLSCVGGHFENEIGPALNVNAITVGADVFLSGGFTAIGQVELGRANITGQLNCVGGHFENDNGPALNADAITVGTDILLSDGFAAKGEVRLRGAKITGQLACVDGHFENDNGPALNADAITVLADVFLSGGFVAKGEVNLVRADIDGSLACWGAIFTNTGGDALNLSQATIGAGLFLGNLRPVEEGKPNLDGRLILAHASCRTYRDDAGSWPTAGNLILDGFTYERFDDCDTGWESRRDWLLRQPAKHLGWAELPRPPNPLPGWRFLLRIPAVLIVHVFHFLAVLARALYLAVRVLGRWLAYGSIPAAALADPFRPQPWVQAAKVLREMGHEDYSRELSVQREILRARSAGTRWHLRLWLDILRVTIGNGYKPQRALYWSLGFFLAGWLTFATAANLGFMAPREGDVETYLAENPGKPLPHTYPRFNAVIYALDNFLPVIELGQDEAWHPSDNQLGHRRADHATASVWTEGVRLALGHDWTVTGEAPKPPRPPMPVGVLRHVCDWAAGGIAFLFRLGVHRFLYWFLEIMGWLFVSLYIAGMSGIMKDE